jgi:hypothetical protein
MYLPANEDTGGISLGPFFVVGDFAGKRIVLTQFHFTLLCTDVHWRVKSIYKQNLITLGIR